MGMILDVGGFAFPVDSIEVEREWETLMSAQRRPYAEKHKWFAKGRFLADGPEALSALGRAAEVALRRQYQDITFKTEAGSVIYSLPNSTSVDGVKVTGYRNPVEPGILAALLPFEFQVEATYPYTGVGVVVLEFREGLRVGGGGPRYGFTECVNARAEKFQLTPFTVARATQSGTLRTIGGYGVYPQPLFAPDQLPSETEKGKDRSWNGEGVEQFEISWKYEFGSGDFITI
jgi:hypothetical protein